MKTVSELAKQFKLSAKVARRMLRDAGMKKSKRDGWAFKVGTASHLRAVAVLKG